MLSRPGEVLLFSDSFTGADGSAPGPEWKHIHHNGLGGAIVDPTIQGGKLRFLRNDVGGSTCVSCLPRFSLVNSDAVTTFTLDSLQEHNFTLSARFNQGALTTTANHYISGVNRALGTDIHYLSKIINGTQTLIGRSNVVDGASDGDYKLRFQVVGNLLRSKVWAAASEEPSEFQIEVVNSEIPGPGVNGIYAYRDNNIATLHDNYSLRML